MENITLGDISLAVTFLGGLIGGIGYLHKNLKIWMANALDEQLKSIDKELQDLSSRLEKVDLDTCKDFLVMRISSLERGTTLCEIEKERFWEEYEHYLKIGGNSYISMKVEQLKKEGKL